MDKRLCALVFILAVAVSLAVGCSRSSEEVLGRIDLVPDRANMISYVDLGRLVSDADIAQMYEALPKEAADPQTIGDALAKAMDASYLDLADFQEAVLFSDVSEGTGDGYSGAILRGSFEEAGVLASMESAVGGGLTNIEYGSYRIYTGGSQETGLAFLTNDLLVTGSIAAIEDVIAVSGADMSSVSGDLVTAYNRLGDAMFKVALPTEPIVPRAKEFTTDTSTEDVEAALADTVIFSLAMDKEGQAVSFNADISFTNNQAVENFKGLILLTPLLLGETQMPDSVVQNTDDAIIALLPELLNQASVQPDGSHLKIRCDLTVADIEAMSTPAPATGLAAVVAVNMGGLTSSGLNISVDASISNNTPMGLEMEDMQVAVTGKSGRIYSQVDAAQSSIPTGATTTYQRDIVVPLDMVSESGFLVTVEGSAKALSRSVPFSASVEVTTASIESLITIPDIDLGVDFGELTTDGLHMGLQADLTNHNAFGMDIGDLQIVAKGESGNVILTSNIRGCSIGPDATGTLSSDLLLPLGALDESSIAISVQTQAGFAGITLPINAKVTMQVPDLGTLVEVPAIDLVAEFGKLTSDGLEMVLQTTISNHNPFRMDVGDIKIVATGESGVEYINSTMAGCSIGPAATGTLSGDLLIPPEILDESSVAITVQTEAGFAGFTMPISAEVTMQVPDIESIVEVPEINLGVDFGELTTDGLHMMLQTTLTNSNELDLIVGDVQIVATGELGNVIFTSTMPGCTIVPGATGVLYGDLLIPLEVLNESSILMTVQTEAGFAGITLPISAKVAIQVPDMESMVEIPQIDLGVEFGELTSSGLEMMLETTLTNSNPFGIDVGDIQIVAKGDSDNVIFTSTMEGCHIGPDATGAISGDLLMPLEILNESSVVITVQTEAGFAGITLPISAKITVAIPDIGSLITIPTLEINAEATLGLFNSFAVSTVVPNSSNVDLIVGDIQVTLVDQNGDVVDEMTILGGTITAGSSRTFAGSMSLSYSDLASLLAGEFKILVSTEVGIAGVNTTIPINAVVTMTLNLPFNL